MSSGNYTFMSGSSISDYNLVIPSDEQPLTSLSRLIEYVNHTSFLTVKNEGQGNTSSGQQTCALDLSSVDKKQGIVYAEMDSQGNVLMKITTKAAGFVIGGKGSSIRAICSKTGVQTRSWLSCHSQTDPNAIPIRIFLIEGQPKQIYEAMQIIMTAVERYRALVEGEFKDHKVESEQMIEGISFEYKPPPLTLMAKAARTIRNQFKIAENRSDVVYTPQVPNMQPYWNHQQLVPTPTPYMYSVSSDGSGSLSHVEYYCPSYAYYPHPHSHTCTICNHNPSQQCQPQPVTWYTSYASHPQSQPQPQQQPQPQPQQQPQSTMPVVPPKHPGPYSCQ
eukprot:TRINITY_DN14645_c0_g2_i1.p2 TRINITY_DN14645_c0_g2~~TRINITY_DN14645_c0_g2_i1.p2  ORF type:complete len:334 (-),score=18.44 TRINITY_DN14645_c0_g2_i1:111-1112(-)